MDKRSTKVFYAEAGTLRHDPENEFYSAAGWYYQIEGERPTGPFDSRHTALDDAMAEFELQPISSQIKQS